MADNDELKKTDEPVYNPVNFLIKWILQLFKGPKEKGPNLAIKKYAEERGVLTDDGKIPIAFVEECMSALPDSLADESITVGRKTYLQDVYRQAQILYYENLAGSEGR